jgi:hypothetical protein
LAVGEVSLDWREGCARAVHPAFASVRGAWQRLEPDVWPNLSALNALIRGHANIRNAPLTFAAPDGDGSAVNYERGIATSGEIPIRTNWHDLFNALAWASWPGAKAAISEMHLRQIEASLVVVPRGPLRDALTLFDESGAVVIGDPPILQAIREFRWREVFLERRDEWESRTKVLLFGHALMEQMLNPRLGLTAKCVLLDNESVFNDIDARLAAHLLNPANIRTPRDLHPLPILGIPGWDARNESPDFYANADYFRPGRMRDQKGTATADA